MFEYKKLKERYDHDATFNKVVNLHIDLLEKYGFLPSEIREAFFFAQYKYEMYNARQIIKTQEDYELEEKARQILKTAVFEIESLKGQSDKNKT